MSGRVPAQKGTDMARSNRIRKTGAYYHVTSRIVNKERWLSDPAFKDKIETWMYDLADFSGVELLAWAIMDNHFHIYLHVPDVPEEYLLPSSTGDSSLPDGFPPSAGDSPHAVATPAAGDRPRFMLPDDEVVRRLAFLYGEKRARAIAANWSDMRAHGLDHLVDARKAAFCRRMYDVSEYVKTLKERIAEHIRRTTGHVGAAFEGRFRAGLVEGGFRAGELVSLYIDFNPFKAGMTRTVAGYRWTSFAVADGHGPRAERARRAYERIYGLSWAEVRTSVLAAFADRLPEGARSREGRVPEGMRLRVSQIVRLRVGALSRGAFIATSLQFGKTMLKTLPPGFSRPSLRSLHRLLGMIDWESRAA